MLIKRLKRVYLYLLSFLVTIIVLTVLFVRNSYTDKYNDVQIYYINFSSKTSLRSNPKKNLFDISNFSFLIKPAADFCYTDVTKIKAVFIVTSHISNVETRSAMRRAFSKDDLNQLGVRRVFLLGISSDDKYISQKAIEDEARRYGDLVQGNFHEAYRNLTYKHVMGLRWVNKYCGNTEYVIKMDDDIVVNLLKLLSSLKRFDAEEDFISGYVLKDLQVRRIKANKWYVTKEEYSPETYPRFVSGWLYITTPKVSKKLEHLADEEKYFWIDDVFVTGILAEKINIKMHDIREFYTDHPEYFQCCLNDFVKYRLDCDIIVGPNGGRTNLFNEFNKVFSSCSKGGCTERLYRVNESCTKSAKIRNLGKGNAIISSYKLV